MTGVKKMGSFRRRLLKEEETLEYTRQNKDELGINYARFFPPPPLESFD